MELRDKRSKHRRSLSLCCQANRSLKVPVSRLSGSNSRSCSTVGDSDNCKRHAWGDKEHLKIIYFVNHRFKKAVLDCTYRLVDTSTEYDRSFFKYIVKMTKRMAAKMKPHTLNAFNPISSIGIMKNFKLASDINVVHEGAAICLFRFFMNWPHPLRQT